MGENAVRRAELASRAAIMKLWQDEDSYALFQLMVKELYGKALHNLRKCDADHHNYYNGYLDAIEEVSDLANRAIREQRNEMEKAHG